MRKKPLLRQFSVELNSANHVRLETLNGGKTLIRGFLGKILKLSFVEGVFLEIKGCYGVLRVDVKEEELADLLQRRRRR